ncbi:RNA polymerase I-specific transcription initiation factor RRN7 [Cryptococcus neoformans]|nr:RNA polymerase I-specific transcription initiation factor RRN7 [Cryptococcus neoformans var. grubii Th84]OXH17195.1 RNA polymerase I-specific transcription initiation factor RRN7 [Cryptococcus neoformans var. grubii]OXH37088.1 RNA polymerase I-specific transcription initiation factor RRN7 [Cryptococcus neoformans var. grubii]OXH58058.1 RNA polymerase I-specific transcription initiation factor RRN7 [Cryptococcus neoformans var. grubii]OXH58423.1 RNA polymerase I-specific transcription initiat
MARKCPVCGSRKWKRDRITGSAICEDGHVLQDFRSELHVVDGAVNYALTRRRLAKAPRYNKRKMEGRRNQEFFHGSQAEILKLQAFQLLLRHQVHSLGKLWNLPDTFEMIVKDLWTYQLLISTLLELPLPKKLEEQELVRPSTPPPIPYNHPQFKYVVEEDEEQDSEDEVVQHPDPYQRYPDSERSDVSKSDSEEEEEDEREEGPDVDPEIIERLEESDKEEEVNQSNMDDKKKGDTRWKRKRRLRISDTITTLVVALWIIRVPIMGLDIERLISTMAIPFIDFGHTTYIPDEMKRHMNKDVMQALTPSRSPTPIKVHDSCRIFARILRRKYGVQIPSFNLYPVSWRIISCLGGNPAIHQMTVHLLRLMNINFRLITRQTALITRPVRGRRLGDNSTSVRRDGKRKRTGSPEEDQGGGKMKGKEKEMSSDEEMDGDDLEEEEERNAKSKEKEKGEEVWETYERTKMMYDELPPEVSVAAAWVIVMKMLYGLDGQPRKAIVSEDPAIGLPQEAPWLKELCERFENGLFKTRDRGPSKKLNFITMQEDELDAFLNKSEEILLDHRAPIPDANRFPLPPFKPQQTPIIPPNTWVSHHSSLLTIPYTEISPLSHSSELLPLMPGEKIRSYSTSDRAGMLPKQYETVLKCAAQSIGWKKAVLGKIVEVFERKLIKLKGVRNKKLRALRVRKRAKLERKKKIEEARMAKSKNVAAKVDGLPAQTASRARANDKATKKGRIRAINAVSAPNRTPSRRAAAPSRATSTASATTASTARAASRPLSEGRGIRTSSMTLSTESGPGGARTTSQTSRDIAAKGRLPTLETSVAATPDIISPVIATPRASKTNSRVRSVSPTSETPKRPKIMAAPKSARTSRENSRARSGTPSNRPLAVRTRSMTSLMGEL